MIEEVNNYISQLHIVMSAYMNKLINFVCIDSFIFVWVLRMSM